MSDSDPRHGPPDPDAAASPTRRNTLVRILEPLLWLGLALFVLARFGPQIEAWTGIGPGPAAESSIPDALSLTTLDGGELGPDDFDGRVRVLTFWATWCRVCEFELPFVQRLHEEWEESDQVRILGLSIDRTGRDDLSAHVREKEWTFPQAFATSELRRAVGATRAVPTTVIAGPDGRIHHVLVGVTGPGTLSRAVRRLVEQERRSDD